MSLHFFGIGFLKRHRKLAQDLLVIHHLALPVLQNADKHLIFCCRLVLNVDLMDRAVFAKVVRLQKPHRASADVQMLTAACNITL